MTYVHVFPVPRGMTPEDAFYEQEVMGKLVDYRWWKPRFHWPFVKWYVWKIEEKV